MSSVRVKVKCDKKELLNLRARLKNLDDWSGKAGFWQEQKHPNKKLNAAELANILEYGANYGKPGFIPPRPFIHDGAMDSLIELRSMYVSAFYNFVERKKTPRAILKPMADAMARWIATRILFNNYSRNAPYTVEQKGFDRPLYETGWLSENVKTKTRRKDADE
jgi:hypothetical protein